MTQREAELEILQHRYRYYMLGLPVISDYHYDQLEAEYRKRFPESEILNSVGSDREESYPDEVRDALRRSA